MIAMYVCPKHSNVYMCVGLRVCSQLKEMTFLPLAAAQLHLVLFNRLYLTRKTMKLVSVQNYKMETL